MRSIFTSILSLVLFMAVSNVSYSQANCATNLSPQTTYSQSIGGTATAFSGGGGANADFLTGIFYSNTAQACIDFSYNFQNTNAQNVGVVATITLRYSVGGVIQTRTCSTTEVIIPGNSTTTVYFSICPTGGIPVSTNFDLQVSFDNQETANNRNLIVSGGQIEVDALPAGAGSILPVKFAQFSAKSVGNEVQLNWTIDAEENTKAFQVERSADGRNYSSIGQVNAQGARTYSFVDASPLAAAYYRIKAIDNDGHYGYSVVVRMKGNAAAVEVKAFLSGGNRLTVQHDMAPAGSRISVMSADGKLVSVAQVIKGAQQTSLDISSARPGLLLVRFETAGGQAEVVKLVKP